MIKIFPALVNDICIGDEHYGKTFFEHGICNKLAKTKKVTFIDQYSWQPKINTGIYFQLNDLNILKNINQLL